MGSRVYPENKDAIAKITKIRANNNLLWMEILRIAFNEHPVAARRLMKKISKNDKEITKWLGKL